MRLFPQRDERTDFLYIEGYLTSRFTNYYHPRTITFIISDSILQSSISYMDAYNCGVQFEKLSYGDNIDEIQTKILPNCGISFILENKPSMITEFFKQIPVLCNISKKIEDSSLSVCASILGKDFLSRYESHPILDTVVFEKI